MKWGIREASQCAREGKTSSDDYTPQDSMAIAGLLYDIRTSWGMRFEGEER